MTVSFISELADHLECAARESLETMCFYGVLGRSADVFVGEDLQAVSLKFHGDACGTVVLQISCPALVEITANFFGEEPLDMKAGQAEAVACELANMVCGAALSQWQPEGHFELSQPETLAQGSQPQNGEPQISLPLDLENGKLVVCVWVD